MTSKTYTIHSEIIGTWENYSHLLVDNGSRQAVIFDPAWDADKIIANIKKHDAKLTAIWLTHAHFDHANAIFDLIKALPVPVYLSEHEINLLALHAEIHPFGKIPNDTQALHDNMPLQLGNTQLNFISTPGHSPGSGCFMLQDDMITGDTLFIDGCGRTDLFGSDPQAMLSSLRRIAQLSPHLTLHTGHAYGSSPTDTLANQLRTNPYLRNL